MHVPASAMLEKNWILRADLKEEGNLKNVMSFGMYSTSRVLEQNKVLLDLVVTDGMHSIGLYREDLWKLSL